MSSSLLTRTGVAAGLAVLSALTLSGCGGSAATEDLPRKSFARWSSALDEFVPRKEEAASYAALLLDAACMRDAGYSSWAPPWRDTNPDPGPGWNPVGIRLFSLDLATTYGYRIPPAVRSDTNPEWVAFAQSKNGALEAGEQKAFTACADADRAKHRVVNLDGGTLNLAMGYMSLASEKARASETTKAAEKGWRTCMAPQGVADLPQTPEDMPSRSLTEAFGIGQNLEGPASAGEIEVAMADARCRQSSGYSTTFYDIRWDESVRLLRENRDRLERARELITAHDKAVQEVINAHAPSRPDGP